MRAFASSALLLFAACGASPPAEPSAGPPASAGAEAPPENGQPEDVPPENPESLASRVLVRLEAHIADLRAAPRELQGDEAFALSSAIMDAIDAEPLSDALRLRADQAAEAILTDRSPEGAIRAAKQALEVLQEVVDAEE